MVYDPVPTETTYNEAYNWTGAYVGGHVGWAWDESNFDVGDEPLFKWWAIAGRPHGTSIDGDGFIGGGQIGYWHQTNRVLT